jgi:hypothetical protein
LLQILVIDDAQKLFQHKEFWQELLKDETRQTCIIAAASYSLESIDRSTPTGFSVKKTYNDLRLEEREQTTLLDKFAKVRDDQPLFGEPLLRASVMSEAAGNVGVLRTSLEKLSQHFAKKSPTVASALQFQCSNAFFGQMSRCFLPLESNTSETQRAILTEVVMKGSAQYLGGVAEQKEEQDAQALRAKAVVLLLQACVLVQQDDSNAVTFATPMHKRFYMSQIFPSCSLSSAPPKDIDDFLVSVISKFTVQGIKTKFGFTPKTDFPSEATFQAEFYRHAAALLPPGHSISAEVSRIVTGGSLWAKTGFRRLTFSTKFYPTRDWWFSRFFHQRKSMLGRRANDPW